MKSRMIDEQEQQSSGRKGQRAAGMWLAVGIAIGIGIGAAFGNPAYGAGIGVAIGVALGIAQRRKKGP